MKFCIGDKVVLIKHDLGKYWSHRSIEINSIGTIIELYEEIGDSEVAFDDYRNTDNHECVVPIHCLELLMNNEKNLERLL